MNKAILMGRLTRDPHISHKEQEKTQEQMCIARYTLAVDRRKAKDEEQYTDFIGCVAFGRSAEFAEKYLKQGIKIIVTGRIQTGSYTNKDGYKVYTTDVIVEEQEFAESKRIPDENTQKAKEEDKGDGFMNIPDGIEEELPFA